MTASPNLPRIQSAASAIDAAVLRPVPSARMTAMRGSFPPSVEERVADDATDGTEAVLPRDLLARLIAPAVIGDRNLVDPTPQPRHLGGELRLETESIGLQIESGNQAGAKHLVAGFHVGQVQVREHVRKRRQEPVPHVVPEEQDAMSLPPESRSVDHVRLVFQDRLEETGVLPGVVLQIRVLDDDD